MVSLPNKATWLVTANNPSTSQEVGRRRVRIRIDAGTDRPWLRRDFQHDPLRPWVLENRVRLVEAVLLLIQAWVAAGRPVARPVLGSFEEWSQLMGGILDVAEIPGFLGNLEELYEAADQEGQQWRAFCATWWTTYVAQYATAAQLHKLAKDNELLHFLGGNGERSSTIRLGKALHDRRGQHFGAWQIHIDDKDPTHTRYRLSQTD